MLTLLFALAHAAPVELQHQGRLLDATSGLPLTGSHTLTLALYDVPNGGTALWTETQSPTFDDGYFAVFLGEDDQFNPLDPAWFDGPGLFLGVAIDGGAELPIRQRIVSVPWAIQASQAATATSVSGGVVDASEIRVGGNVVIDGTGGFQGGPTLDSLACSANDIPIFDGTDWVCTAASGSTLTEAEVDGFVANNGYALAADLATIATTGLWDDLIGIPADLLDGDDLLDEAAVDLFVANNGYAQQTDLEALDTSLATIAKTGAWSDLVGVPGDIADGDDDTLAELTCGDDEVAAWSNGSNSWTCQPRVLTETEVEGMISNGSITIGPSSDACTAANGGSLRWDAGSSRLELCNGTEWRAISAFGNLGSTQALAAASCKEILDDGSSQGDGLYWIDPNDDGNTADARQTECDMLGGGFTHIDAGWIDAVGVETPVAGSPTYSGGGTVTLPSDCILHLDIVIPFTEYRMSLSASNSDGSADPDDTSGWTNAEFLSAGFPNASIDYNKNTEIRNGIVIASFTPGNTCDNDGEQILAWGTDQQVHDLKIGGEFGCNYQGGAGTGFDWSPDYIQTTPSTSVLRFKHNDSGETVVGRNLDLWVR